MIKMQVRDNALGRDATKREATAVAVSGRPVARNATAGAATLTTQEVVPGGVLVRTGAGAGYTDTLPTAALLTAANPDVADGEGFTFAISNRVAFIETLAGGTGVTLVAGSNTTLPANTSAEVLLIRTSATAWTFEIIGG